MFKIVLIEPEIPQNTGNIGRTCVASGCELHLVGPMGFKIDEKKVRRAGLDYWPHLKLFMYESFSHWQGSVPAQDRVFYFSAKAKSAYHSIDYQRGDWLVFGKETKGLDPDILRRNKDKTHCIPIEKEARSLNLATSVAIVAFEGIRQLGVTNSKQ